MRPRIALLLLRRASPPIVLAAGCDWLIRSTCHVRPDIEFFLLPVFGPICRGSARRIGTRRRPAIWRSRPRAETLRRSCDAPQAQSLCRWRPLARRAAISELSVGPILCCQDLRRKSGQTAGRSSHPVGNQRSPRRRGSRLLSSPSGRRTPSRRQATWQSGGNAAGIRFPASYRKSISSSITAAR